MCSDVSKAKALPYVYERYRQAALRYIFDLCNYGAGVIREKVKMGNTRAVGRAESFYRGYCAFYLFEFSAQHAFFLLFTGIGAKINYLPVLKEIVDMPVRLFFSSQVPLYPLCQVVLGASNIDIKSRYEWKRAETSNFYVVASSKFNNKAIYPF